jgi:hypothetical protein
LWWGFCFLEGREQNFHQISRIFPKIIQLFFPARKFSGGDISFGAGGQGKWCKAPTFLAPRAMLMKIFCSKEHEFWRIHDSLQEGLVVRHNPVGGAGDNSFGARGKGKW